MREPYVSAEDKKFLKLALNLARRNVGLTGKNPSVGCVITFKDIIIGRGNTQLGGRPHAEIMAIKQASDHPLLKEERKIEDINIYITLEPCAHETTAPACAKVPIYSLSATLTTSNLLAFRIKLPCPTSLILLLFPSSQFYIYDRQSDLYHRRERRPRILNM